MDTAERAKEALAKIQARPYAAVVADADLANFYRAEDEGLYTAAVDQFVARLLLEFNLLTVLERGKS